MLEKVKKFLTDFITALQTGKIYTVEHPAFMDFTDKAYLTLKGILKEKSEIVIGIVEDELAFEKEIFFDLSQKLRSLIGYLKERGIERIVFHKNLKEEELIKFISYLISQKKKISLDSEGNLPLPEIKNIEAGKIKVPLFIQKETPKGIKPLKQDDSLQTISSTIEKVLKNDEIDYLDLKFNLLDFMENFAEKYEEFLYLISIKRKDLITFLHLLAVSLLSMYFSSKMRYSKEDVLDIGIAGLFHDIGKISIARKILTKEGKLAEEEFTRVMDHSILGTRIMIRYTDSLGILPTVVTFEHHIRYDKKGYPKLFLPRKLHPASMIVSLCDVYDALTQKRIYKKDFPPLRIYNIMKKEKGGLFHPELLDRFFQVMGVWPVGTIVSLSDGRIAIVRDVNEKDIFCPEVEVIHPEKNKEFIDLVKKKDVLKIEEALNPFGEGKKYLHMI